jgi:hypothetical protein
LLWGQTTIPGKSLEFAYIWGFLNGFTYPDRNYVSSISGLSFSNIAILFTNQRDLMQLMADTFTFESTDKRDQIFALLGLLPDLACNIIANYKKSKAEVYTELALNLIL